MRSTTTFGGRPQLETLAQAEAENLRRIDALVGHVPDIAATIEACDRKARCGSVICAVDARAYRFRMIRKLLAISNSRPGQHEIATIYLKTFPAGTLATGDVDRELGRLRKSLKRNGFKGSHLIGGTEVNWDSANKVWELHVHLLAIGVPPAAWKSLRAALHGVGPKFPVKVQLLRNPERQISYIIKFHTYFRPKPLSGGARSSKASLPRSRLVELAMWWSGYRFADFIFLLGAKSHGDRIILHQGSRHSSSDREI